LKIAFRVAVAVASVFLFVSSSGASFSQTTKAGASPTQVSTTKAKANPKAKTSRKQKAADEAKAKALADARRPRICETRVGQCSYGVGAVGEPCSCWSKSGAPDAGLTVRP
jgi:guanyl-specific ribonuclease Sa